MTRRSTQPVGRKVASHTKAEFAAELGIPLDEWGPAEHDAYIQRFGLTRSSSRVVERRTTCNEEPGVDVERTLYETADGSFLFGNSTARQPVDDQAQQRIKRRSMAMLPRAGKRSRWNPGRVLRACAGSLSRRRGAGRPAGRRRATRSCARSGDSGSGPSGEPGPGDPAGLTIGGAA